MQGRDSLSIGACPLAAFPNDHLNHLNSKSAAHWAPKHETCPIAELRKAVNNADWGHLFAQRETRVLCSSAWSASERRCEKLQALCRSTGAKRILEIGSFCGVSTMAMAKVLPENGQLTSLEIDPFVVDFRVDIKAKCEYFWKIMPMVGPARQSLKQLVKRAQEPGWKPFDLAIIDADREGMMDYFDILCRENSGVIKDNAIICVDTTPFKGQMSVPYVKYGKPDSWLINSGQTEIDELRKFATDSEDYDCKEDGCLLEVRKKRKLVDCSSGKNPLASFSNDHIAQEYSKWVEKQVTGPVDELRKAINNEDWAAMFGEGLTKLLASPAWSASPERCEKLRRLCQSSRVNRVLDVGSFCGVASLAMAEALPDHGQVVSLEIDPFLATFGDDIKSKSDSWQKVSRMVGPAQDSLKLLAKQTTDPIVNWASFDLVVVDADKANMMDYFDMIWRTPGFLAESGIVVVDTTPFKGQFFVQFVKGKLDDWIVSSGQESIEAFLTLARSMPNATVTEEAGLAIVRRA